MDYETALKIANAFGGGMGKMGESCGAVTGAFMIIGLKYGAKDSDDEVSYEKTHELAAKFVKEFKARNKSIICKDLLGFIIGSYNELAPDSREIISQRCPAFVKDAAEIIEEIIG